MGCISVQPSRAIQSSPVTRHRNWTNRTVLWHVVYNFFCKKCKLCSGSKYDPSLPDPGLEKSEFLQSNSEKIASLRKQDLCIFAQRSVFNHKIKQNCFNLPSLKLKSFRIRMMKFWYLKGCGSERLGVIIWIQVHFTTHGNKSFISWNVPKQNCLFSFNF